MEPSMTDLSPTSVQVPPRTIAKLLGRIAADPDLTDGQRRSMACDVRSFVRCIKGDQTMAIDGALFRRRGADVLPAGEGISVKRWANIRSGTNRAFRRYGLNRRSSRGIALTPAWMALAGMLANPRLHRGLSRLVHWASDEGIPPQAIDDEVMRRFHRHLTDEAFLKRPNPLFRESCKLWNDAVAGIPGWPGQRVTLPCFRDLVSLPEAAFPPSLWTEFERYAAIIGGHDPIAPNAPDRPLREATLRHHRRQFRLFASAMVKAGIPAAQIGRLADLVDLPNFEAGVRWLHERHGGKSVSLFELVASLTALARSYLRLPESQVRKLAAIRNRLNCRVRGMTDKNRQRLAPLKDPRRLAMFLNLADALAAEGRRSKSPRKKALLAETALVHEILLAAPVRFGNLVRLDLNRHFRFDGPGRSGRITITIAAEEVKNDRPLEFVLPPPVGRRLGEFLQRYRPILLGGRQSDYLFPGDDHGHKHPVSLSHNLCKAVARHVGIQVNPHLYRHIAAYAYLKVHPGEYETVRQLLGHRSLQTTVMFYAGFERDSAVERYNKVVLEQRGNAPATQRRKRA
jgi:site-specific recombinase XerD